MSGAATTSGLTVASRPYPWPWDGLDPARLALVLAGWDAHWAARTTAPEPGTDPVGAVHDLAAAVVAVGGLVVRAVHARPPRAPADLPDPAPLDEPHGATLPAAGIDAFHGSALAAWLRAHGRDQLLLVGHGLEGPVHSTMRSANDRGDECLLVTDACTALRPDLVVAAASQVCMSGGIFGAVATTADVLAVLGRLPARPSGEAMPVPVPSPTQEVTP